MISFKLEEFTTITLNVSQNVKQFVSTAEEVKLL